VTLQTVRLGDVVSFNPAPPKRLVGSEIEVSFVPMASVSELGAMAVTEHRTGSELNTGFSYFQNGDTLVAKITPCYENNKICSVAIDREHGFGSTEFHVLRPNPSRLDTGYLTFFLRQDRVREAGTRRMTGSAGQRRVPRAFLEALEIPLPLLDEQRRIAAILDQADELRRKRREATRKLQSLAAVAFFGIFGDPRSERWPRISFGGLVSQPLRNGVSPSGEGQVDATVLTLSAVTGAAFNEKAIKSGRFKSSPPASQRVSSSDLLICRGNGNKELVGKGYFPHRDVEELVFPDTIIAARVDATRIVPDFLEYVWNAPETREKLEGRARTTNGTYKINQSILEEIEIPDPPITLQLKFSGVMDEIKRQLGMQCDQLGKLDEVFVSLQHRAFRGWL
jgi:type I restriction enzyme S subunit